MSVLKTTYAGERRGTLLIQARADINLVRPVPTSTSRLRVLNLVATVALTDFSSRVFPQKFTKKKNHNQKKLDGKEMGNHGSYSLPSSFF